MMPDSPDFSGTDILLGGNPDYMARLKLREMLMPEVVSQGRCTPGVNIADCGHPVVDCGFTLDLLQYLKYITCLALAVDVDDRAFARARDGRVRVRSWAANPDLFPCQLTEAATEKANKAVQV